MKLSISLPDNMAKEIKMLSIETERSISWWIQNAWNTARTELLRSDDASKKCRRALKKFSSLQGTLKSEYPSIDSVTLAHNAFVGNKS
jgi:hypothetical protein